MHAENSICPEYFDGGQKHEVAWTPRAGSSLRVHGHVSAGTISDIIPFFLLFFILVLLFFHLSGLEGNVITP